MVEKKKKIVFKEDRMGFDSTATEVKLNLLGYMSLECGKRCISMEEHETKLTTAEIVCLNRCFAKLQKADETFRARNKNISQPIKFGDKIL
jgi:hypothetical protein